MSKQFSLTKEEQNFLQGRRSIRAHHEYLTKLIDHEVQGFIDQVVRKRLGLKIDDNLIINDQDGKITVGSETNQEQQQPAK